MKKHRVFMGFIEIAGYYNNLRKGLREIGIDCHFFQTFPNIYCYDEKENLSIIEKIVRKIAVFRKKRYENKEFKDGILYFPEKFLHHFALSIYVLCLMFKYDVFILSGGYMPMGKIFFPLLKLLKKKIICVFHGSASRPPYMDGYYVPNDIEFSVSFVAEKTMQIRRFVDEVNKYADAIIDARVTSLFHSKDIIDWFYVGCTAPTPNPIESDYNDIAGDKKSIRILHCPSRPIDKGTAEIEKAINNLISKGYSIDFVKIVGQPNSVVMEELSKCDFIVNELYSDCPSGSFLAEAASCGKPAVTGGYYSEFIEKEIPAEWVIPNLFVLPRDIELAILRMITDTQFRQRIGNEAREFVPLNWSPTAVAKKMLKVIEGDIPSNAVFSPYSLSYTGGYGVKSSWRRQVVRSLVDKYGASILKLDDKPNLRDSLIAEAYGEEEAEILPD
jgi:glycosyltransferase involved in cell wall biosynthesis